MKINHKVNVFLENKKWLNNKIFISKRNINEILYKISYLTLKEGIKLSKLNKTKGISNNFDTNINFILANDALLKKLNTKFLNKKKPTNVLSFPNENFSKNHDGFLGEVFLSYETCKKEAKKFKINFKDRIGHLVVHGILHLLGYDHKTKVAEKKMVRMESKILNLQGINYY